MAGIKNSDELDAENSAPGATHIHLTHSYQGKLTKEQPINPGVYRRDDPKLFGLATYLVDNGHAVWVNVPEVETPRSGGWEATMPPEEPGGVTLDIETPTPPARRGRPRQTPEE